MFNILVFSILVLISVKNVFCEGPNNLIKVTQHISDFLTDVKQRVVDVASSANYRRQKLNSALRKFVKEVFKDEENDRLDIILGNGTYENVTFEDILIANVTTVPTTIMEVTTQSKSSPVSTTTIKPEVTTSTPDVSNMNTSHLLAFLGHNVESHKVLTKDGYILEIFRIISPIKISAEKKKVIILQHGLMGSSDDWLILGPGKSLPYLLLSIGYDVWLTNVRGNRYTKFHPDTIRNLPTNFWDFTFHDIGMTDLPAIIDYIHSVSENEIHCIGHSLGGTALLVMISSLPYYNRILKSVTLLAPLSFMSIVKGPLKTLAEMYHDRNEHLFEYIGISEITSTYNFPPALNVECSNDIVACIHPLIFLCGGRYDTQKMKYILGHGPTGMSAKTLIHLLQLVNRGKFCMYDYGHSINLRRYNVPYPPDYTLREIKISLHLITSPNDWLAPPLNVIELFSYISKITVHRAVSNTNFTHTDFVWSDLAASLVYPFIIDTLMKGKF